MWERKLALRGLRHDGEERRRRGEEEEEEGSVSQLYPNPAARMEQMPSQAVREDGGTLLRPAPWTSH